MPECWLKILSITFGVGTLENKFGLLLKRYTVCSDRLLIINLIFYYLFVAFCRGDVKIAEQNGLYFAPGSYSG